MDSSRTTMDGERRIAEAIRGLERWLESTRTPQGYGGPVVHWWRDCLLYTGAGLDWRYEGIIAGYLNLYARCGQRCWLEKAKRAGEDLLRAQLPGGNYRNSSFERNPGAGGTPHEAACDAALLRLAQTLRSLADPAWQRFAEAAGRNVEEFIIGCLWHEGRQQLGNTAGDPSFVPNKAATAAEALFAWAELAGDDRFVSGYALPILDGIVAAQVHEPGSALDGAIPQAVRGSAAGERYFPFYVARCIPALVQGYQVSGERVYLRGAQAALRFILRYRQPDGALPQVVYRRGGRANPYPQWIAAVGDILRAMALLQPFGEPVQIEPTLQWLLQGRQKNGSIRSARGFASQVSQRPPKALPDFRDVLGVCGWSDKAFRYLSGRPEAAAVAPRESAPAPVATPCSYRGRRAVFHEDEQQVEVRRGRETLYRWRKGAAWAEVCV